MAEQPLFTLVTPVSDPPLDGLRCTIASVLGQRFAAWEWVIVDDASSDPAVRKVLRGAASDRRIRVVERIDPGGAVAALTDALTAARGTFVAEIRVADQLADDALGRLAEVLSDDVDFAYSDEDRIDAAGTRFDGYPKPAWSPERLLGQHYIGSLAAARRSLIKEVGGYRAGFDGVEAHDLALRVTERARRVVHLPAVLYHRFGESESTAIDPAMPADAQAVGRRAIRDALTRRGIAASVIDDGHYVGHYRIVRQLDPATKVSLVIPTMGSRALVWGTEQVLVVESVRSALAMTDHQNVEVVVVYDDHMDPAVLTSLKEVAGDRLVPVRYSKPFNFSEKINVGALAASGDVVVLLNDDIRVREHGWLEQLVAPLADPAVGMTGAKLYFSDGTLQHVGHAYHSGGWGHPYIGWDGAAEGKRRLLRVNREVSGVTAACAALRRETFMAVGGLTEALPVNYNDVDLCYKVAHLGLRIVVVANSELYHFESKSREPGVIRPWERARQLERWGEPQRDAYMPDED